MRRTRCAVGLVAGAALLLLPGCDDLILEDQTSEIEATGTVLGDVFVDTDGSGSVTAPDVPMEDLGVDVVAATGGGPIASATTDTAGVFSMRRVPVGSYRLAVDSATLPDSLEVFGLDEESFVLGAGDTVVTRFRTSFPVRTLAEVQGLEPGRRVFTHGIVLNRREPLGDAAVHLREGDTYLRATSVERVSLLAGDSVRFQGQTATEAGLPVLTDVKAVLLRELAAVPRPVDLSTATAASANGGTLNAALVRVRSGEILDTTTVDDGLVASVDDGSGPVEMVLRDLLGFDPSLVSPTFAVVEQAVGLLVATRDESGDLTWRVLPRAPSDLVLRTFSLRSVAEIQLLGSGVDVSAEGIVLNPVDPAGGNDAVHIRQEGLNLRAFTVSDTPLLPGDSVRLRGTTRVEVGRTVVELRDVSLLQEQVTVPAAVDVTTGNAALAGGDGRLDAGLVRITAADVTDTLTVDGDFVATADDGTGTVDVVIRDFLGFDTSAIDPATSVFDDVVGLLVARRRLDGTVHWRLLPRLASDVTLQ